ncbi:hypothetical protein MRX96_015656 [Rhipicephalus microplus]
MGEEASKLFIFVSASWQRLSPHHGTFLRSNMKNGRATVIRWDAITALRVHFNETEANTEGFYPPQGSQHGCYESRPSADAVDDVSQSLLKQSHALSCNGGHVLHGSVYRVGVDMQLARYSSDTIKGAVSLSYCLHKSPNAASASALPPIVAMEGMFGLKENLTAVCKALAAKTGRNVFAHGLSKATFVGHSLAGRMVMYFAVTKPSAVDRIVVVDTGLIPGPPVLFNKWLPWQASAMEHILSLLSPDMNMEQALQVGDQYLSAKVADPFIRSVLLANLRKGPHSYEWRINIKALRKFLPVMADPHFLGNGHSDVDALFVAADESAYLRADDFKDIKRVFPNARLATVKGANHWVHNKTEEFVDLVRDFMAARRTEGRCINHQRNER